MKNKHERLAIAYLEISKGDKNRALEYLANGVRFGTIKTKRDYDAIKRIIDEKGQP